MKDSNLTIDFVINGKNFSVNKDVDANTKLVDFLRRDVALTGTKWMCREGGCGACIVTLSVEDPVTGKKINRAVNSCLLPLLSCHGCEITTVEGIGSKKNGLHPIQKQLADNNGSQCGYCSPGMVMSMYSLLEGKGEEGVTMLDVESALGGNICRCTGYRPIMDAFKTFAKDAPAELKATCVDLEELGNKKICSKTGDLCKGSCHAVNDKKMFQMGSWYRPVSLDQLMDLLKSFNQSINYRLVAGNTGTGVYKNDGPYEVYVDISKVQELLDISTATPLTVGGGVTLTDLSELLLTVPSTNSDYWYTPTLAEHVKQIGSVPIRNLGSIAGNLMLKHAHREFPSDLFIVLETVGAKVVIMSASKQTQELTLLQFLETEMNGQIILSVKFPPISPDHVIRTFKIMPRSCNAHAYINAGFCAKVARNDVIQIVGKPTIIYGGIRTSLTHAIETENYLADAVFDEVNFQSSLKILELELQPEEHLLNPDVDYLTTVAQGLFYKFALTIIGEKAAPAFRSGALNLERQLTTGKQDYDTDSKEWPVHQPTIKVEARSQCSGEAQYIDDTLIQANELHGAFVLSTMSSCSIDVLDASDALKMEGVVAFLDAKTIKTGNLFVFAQGGFDSENDEEVFSSGNVVYAGQSLGLIVAKTQYQAVQASKAVRVTYKDFRKPVLTIKEALLEPGRTKIHAAFGPSNVFDVGNTEEGFAKSETVVEGEFEIGTQYHFYMETLVTLCVPTEDGMNVYCATQDQDAVQNAIARCLNFQKAQINVETRRLGGSYGGKISRSTLVATAAAIAAYELSKPVRIALDLESNMALVGGRLPYYCKYKAGTDKDGLLQAVDMTIISDCGGNFNEGTAFFAASFAKNCYASTSWKFTPLLAKTDTPSNTYCRAPGTTQGIAIIENLIEHLAKSRQEDPFEFRMKNLNTVGSNEISPMRKIIDEVRQSSEYENRLNEIKEFNRNNRWKKRGINLLPMVYPVDYAPFRYNVMVAIHHNDGSVAVSHGGIECGQGVNTKVIQVVARELEIDLSLISVKPTNSFTNANGSVTGGSMTSELNCFAAMKACQELKRRMLPIKEKMPDASWSDIVEQCFNSNIDLSARHYYTSDDKVSGYVIHGATVSEVEVDVLTGEKLIRRVDILEDAGQSLSPLLDIGQIEGAFVMGVGLWTSEKITYDPQTGKKLSSSTWNYKPPLNRDIPMDFRVTMLKNAGHSFGVLRSKATGEPPLCMSVSVFFALRNAVDAARSEVGHSDWYQMDGPATVDKLQKMMLPNFAKLVFQ